MYKNITLEVIYIFILAENALRKSSRKNFDELLNFFSLNTLFDIKIYSVLRPLFMSSYNLSLIKSILNDDKINKSTKLMHIKKFREFLLLFIKNHSVKKNINSARNKLNILINILKNYPQNDLTVFLLEIFEYIYMDIDKNKKSFVPYLLYLALEEYADLFSDADKIIFNNKTVNKQFKTYFDLLHIKPENICFINKKNNIKIMWNFFPFEILCKICSLSGYKTPKNPNKKYFLIEYDKKLVTKKSSELLLHETGHFLNLKVFNFQEKIAAELYEKDKTVNTIVLSCWLNEIIADITGSFLCENGNFADIFKNSFKETEKNINYPPITFRSALLEEKEYDFSLLQNMEIKKAAMLIYNNIDFIKNTIKTCL